MGQLKKREFRALRNQNEDIWKLLSCIFLIDLFKTFDKEDFRSLA
jgi:hypothetical protein